MKSEIRVESQHQKQAFCLTHEPKARAFFVTDFTYRFPIPCVIGLSGR